jgi:hypothetical protein
MEPAGNVVGIVWGLGMVLIGTWQGRRHRTEEELREAFFFDVWMTRIFLRRETTDEQLRERYQLVRWGSVGVGGLMAVVSAIGLVRG